jgi:hypothetical protein
MSYQNYPQGDDTNGTSFTQPQKNGNGKNVLIGILGAALLGSFGYIYYVNDKASSTIATKDGIINAGATEKEALQAELNEASAKYDELQSLDAKKDSSLSAKDMEISAKRAEIQKILSKANASKEELAQAKGLIKQLNGTLTSYKQEIAALKQKNALLAYERDSVTVERETARSEREAAKGERDKYRRDYDSTTLVVKQKESTIDVASTLHASNFAIAGINEKNNGKEKTTSTAKKVDKLRISFELDENRVAPSGKKDLYISIIAPDGTPVSVQALGSGTFTTRDGKEKVYTQKLSVDYMQNSKQSVQFDWKQNSDYQKGSYKIEVYNNGFKIGEGLRELKKAGLFG